MSWSTQVDLEDRAVAIAKPKWEQGEPGVTGRTERGYLSKDEYLKYPSKGKREFAADFAEGENQNGPSHHDIA